MSLISRLGVVAPLLVAGSIYALNTDSQPISYSSPPITKYGHDGPRGSGEPSGSTYAAALTAPLLVAYALRKLRKK